MKASTTTANQSLHAIVSIQSHKSITTAVLLAFLFGPLGMLYSTILGALIMFAISIFMSLYTFGIGLIITWPICILWAGIAARNSISTQMSITTINK